MPLPIPLNLGTPFAGGHRWYYPQGIDDYLLAYALPDREGGL
jgi:hypothetical protein